MVLHFCVWQTPRIPLLICFIRHYRESFRMLDIAEKHINRLCCRHTQNMSSPCDFQAPKWNRSTLSIRLALANTTFHFDTRTSECTISKRWARWLHLIRAAICECVWVRLYVFLRVYWLHEVKRHAKVARVEHMKEIFLDIMAINRNWRFRFIAHYYWFW